MGTTQRTGWAIIAFALIGTAVSWPARAQDSFEAQKQKCSIISFGSPDETINACTAMIQSGRYSGKDLAWAYSNRGGANVYKRQNDRAIEDFDEALKLDPKLVDTFNNRGFAYIEKGQYDRAIQDFDEAIRLAPKFAAAFYVRGLAKRNKDDMAGGDADIAQAERLVPNVKQLMEAQGFK